MKRTFLPVRYCLVCSALALAGAACTPVRAPNARTDPLLEPPHVNTSPGPEYQDDVRWAAMILGMDRTPKGRIWGCWTGTGDNTESYFLLATSDDGGTTWSKPRVAIDPQDIPGKPPRYSLVGNLWSDPTGRLWLFFDQHMSQTTSPGEGIAVTGWYIICDNPDADEPTWSKPAMIGYGSTLNKPTVLKTGEWLLPVAIWNPQASNGSSDIARQQMAHVYVSTDEGRTWRRRGGTALPIEEVRFYEHMFVELRDARLWMLMRSRLGIAESFSSDAGRTWSEPRPSAIENPSARFFIRRLASGRLLLVKNGPIGKRTSRTHMTAFLSSDDGNTWSDGLLLDERGLLSYPDGFQSPDGLIRILYDWNRHGDAEILLAAFREEDVLAGNIVSPDAKTRFVVNKARAPHLSQSIVPDPKWTAQAVADAKLDLSSTPYDGVSSKRLVNDTALRETPDGSWVLSAMVENASITVPSKDAFVVRSRDKGKTWSAPETLNTGFPREGKTLGLGPPEIVVHGGQSMLFFSTHAQDWPDDWRTWFCPVNARLEPSRKPSPVVGRLEHRTFIRSHIVTRDGNIMVPFQHYEGGKNDKAAGQSQNAFTDPRIGVLISSTGGETWTAHGDIRLAPVKRRFGWEESNLIELADGRIVMLIRQARHMGMVYRAESTDGGKTWPDVASLYRAPNHGTETYFALDGNAVAMIHNPAGRLALWISFDGMRSWPYQRILMQTSSIGPKHYMSYPHGFVSSDKQWLHFAYVDSSQRAAHFSAKLPPLK